MKRRQSHPITLLLTLAILITGNAVFAKDEMIIAVHDYAPYYNNEGKGMMIDVYQAACDAAGIGVSFQVLPIKRAITYLFENKIDAFSPGHIFMSPEQVEQVSMVKTFNVVGVFTYLNPGKTKNVTNTISDLKGKKLAIVVNSPLLPIYQQNGLTYDEIQTPELLTKMLFAGRVEFAEGTLLTGLSLTNQLFKDRLKELDFLVITPIECSLAFNKANPRTQNLLQQFTKGFETIKKNGTYIKILESYWGKNNIQKEALPADLVQFGTDKTSPAIFSQYDREPWGKIK
ncbi:MAG: transporter substrate-binding domain-containing protein [Proteobacteria bacterium]|nr:transporter substrate-binding domain-containing protein [Pseudomonadota bacterium]